jgi:ABC-type multidrug transport system ATPase subunit
MTPRELFTFAARLRTRLSGEALNDHIDTILKRLRLIPCQNTVIGGYNRKGLSGGERKRTSIGYEMLAEPELLVLDEPTSGLDSVTSLTILELMKREAIQSQKAVIMTIHQP